MTDWQIEGLKTIERAMHKIKEVPLKDLARLAHNVHLLVHYLRIESEDDSDYRAKAIEEILEDYKA